MTAASGDAGSVGAGEFRQALSRWATGVTVVTVRSGGRVHGMTVTAFSPVSLEPPLILVCADKGSTTLSVLEEGRVFAVNILARDQRALSERFASKQDEWRRFEGIETDPGVTGAPLLRGAVANLDCRVVGAHEHGDHVVYVGRVEALRHFEREPLLYHRGAYALLAPG